MTQSPGSDDGELCSLAMKILYTLHGLESQKYIVKPSEKIESRVYRGIDLAILEIHPCLQAMRRASPEFASICDTHADDYAVYSVDFSEEDLPLQCHGKVSQDSVIEATGKLCSSKLMSEHIELHVHVLPIRKPAEMLAKAEEELAYHTATQQQPLPSQPQSQQSQHSQQSQQSQTQSQQSIQQSISQQSQQSQQLHNQFPFLPVLPPPVQIPPSLLRSEPALPSSPPVRARPTKIAQVHPPSGTARLGTKRTQSDAQPAKKRKSTTSPKDEPVSQCKNCGVETASTWRRVEYPEGTKELLCNACALYYKSKRVMRPMALWDKRSRTEYDVDPPIPPAPKPAQHSLHQQHQHQQPPAHHYNSIPPARRAPTLPNNAIPAHYSASQIISSNMQPATPQDSQSTVELWSRDNTSQYLRSDDHADLSDRLVDNPLNFNSKLHTPAASALEPPPMKQGEIDDHMKTALEPPSTPNRKTNTNAPDSIQKLFDFSTPEHKQSTMLLPGSESTGKWLSKVMNNADFEEFLRSPIMKDNKSSIPDLTMFTSSPPTSSNLFSEVSDWSMGGTASDPPPLKLAVELEENS